MTIRPDPKPKDSATLKDRFDAALSTLAGSPLANADADMKHVLDAFADLDPQPIETLTPAEARRQPTPADGVQALLAARGEAAATGGGVIAEDLIFPGAGGNLPVRLYRPVASRDTPLPVVLYFHGGGWVIADIDTYDAAPRALAGKAQALVVSAHYRQAPEHPFPAAHDDAFAIYEWLLTQVEALGGDRERIAVMGESAGANLAINVAIAARDAGAQVPLHQVLVYPVAGVNMDTPSYIENENAKPLNKAMMKWFVGHVLPDEAAKGDARIDLIGRADLNRLPPATVVTAEIDPLRSDGHLLTEKLRSSGVPATLYDYDGVTHEFFGMGAVVAKAADAQDKVAAALVEAFAEGYAAYAAKPAARPIGHGAL